jgi:hydroxyacylglutathione hydrolase
VLHHVIAVGPLQCNCSIVADEATREAAVIDPGDDVQGLLALIARDRLSVKAIVITHAHIDHIGGAMKLKAATGAPVLLNTEDQMLVKMLGMQAAWVGMQSPGEVKIDSPLRDADKLTIGTLQAHVLHTPGHTAGSSCLYFPAEKLLIAGDTLFAGSIGRTDLPGGDFDKIMRSLHLKLMTLPDETRVIPGHGPATTIAEERQTNPFITDKRYKPRIQEG